MLAAVYELGRLYFEMGYLVAAERIFQGLVAVEPEFAPAILGVAVTRVERGAHEEGGQFFRRVLTNPTYSLSAKVGLAAAFVRGRDYVRAMSLLQEIPVDTAVAEGLEGFRAALISRCQLG